MKKGKYRLVGSAGSLEDLIDLISKKFYSKNISVQQVNEKQWDVCNANGLMEDARIVSKGKRFRFEYKVDF